MFGFNRSAMEYVLIGVSVFLLVACGTFWVGKAMKQRELENERAAHFTTRQERDQCLNQLARAEDSIDRQNARVQEWVGRAKEYADAAEQAQAQAKAQARRYESTIARLRATPPPVEQCPQTQDYVKRYLEEERGQ